jgi:hypothetical protein
VPIKIRVPRVRYRLIGAYLQRICSGRSLDLRYQIVRPAALPVVSLTEIIVIALSGKISS